ncbi:MAG: beta strand repeat-containing protein [Pyrinomonadaceae bacterium]
MKISRILPPVTHAFLLRSFVALLAIACAFVTPAPAQTSGGTIISNQASAVYSDGSNSYSSVSNTVTVTVANVSGLRITPDAASNPAVVPGQTNVNYVFTVTNIGNFSNQVRFLANGQSLTLSGPGTITAAVIDNGDNIVGAGDTDIFANGADVLHSLAQNASATVIVRATVSASATAGQNVQVLLGDTATGTNFDNQPADSSAREVRTVSASSVNGLREARGDISASVENDVQLRAVLSVPAGPVALGSNITYGVQACNDGNRAAAAMSLGASSGIYTVAPIPAGTTLAATNSFPAGTLYTTSALSTAPQSATWSTSAPGTLSSVTRVAFNAGASLAGGGACSTSVPLILTITTLNATAPVYGIIDAFATNTVSAVITDQSGDAIANKGDGNADFNEPLLGGTLSATQGFQLPTLLQAVGSVLIGPSGQPAAVGPNDNNDDFTNRSVTTGIAGIPPCAGAQTPACSTDASGVIVFTNTVQNTGNANDTFTLSAPTVPSGFTVEISTNGGTSYTTVSGGATVSLAVAYGNTANVLVRVTAPTGQQILTGFATVIQAASANTSGSTNQTIDRLYTGFVRLDKTANVFDSDGNPSASVPGAIIEYIITYSNVMTSAAAGSGSSSLTATNLVITEDGAAGGNNWATFTTQVTSPAPADSSSGVITDGSGGGAVTTATNHLKDTVPSVAPGASGTFRFRRLIN